MVPEHQRKGIVADIINANKRALEKMNEEDDKFDMLGGLEDIVEEKPDTQDQKDEE